MTATTAVIAGDKSAMPDDSEKQMEAIKAQIEIAATVSPAVLSQYNVLASTVNNCALTKIITEPILRDLLAPAANICSVGSLTATDRTFNRPLAASTGTGVGNGTDGNCSLSGSANAARYNAYGFTVTGCVTFPTVVTASLCGPAGCTAPQSLDTILILYRNVAAGDPLTANGGLPGVFNPASPCTNARAENDDTGGTPTATGGSTCNQLNAADCTAQCGVSVALSQFKRSLGSGQFTIVVSGFGNSTVGNYNLYLDAPAAGCQITLAPTAAAASISGRVAASPKAGLINAVVTLTAMSGESRSVPTGKFGIFRFNEVAAGETSIVSVTSKLHTYAPQVVTVNEDLTELNFAPVE